MSTKKNTAYQRLILDLWELESRPISCFSLCVPNSDDPLTIHANLKVPKGIYKDLILHLIIRISPEYPLVPPAISFPHGFPFDHRHHAQVFDELYGNAICTELTSHFCGTFHWKNDIQGSSWKSSLTLSTVLNQMIVFFSEPDLPASTVFNKDTLDELRSKIELYEIEIITNDGIEKGTVVHSTNNPYPPYSKPKSILIEKNEIPIKVETQELPSEKKESPKESPLKEKSSRFPARKTYVKRNLESKALLAKDTKANDDIEIANSEKSTSEESNTYHPKYSKVYQPKGTSQSENTETATKHAREIPEVFVPANSEWRLGYIGKNERVAIPKTIVIITESKKSYSKEESLIEDLLSSKEISDFFAIPQNSNPENFEGYEKIVSPENTFEEVEELAAKEITCSFSNINYFHKSVPIFGYLVNHIKDDLKGNKKSIPSVLPELVSYQALPKSLRTDLETLDTKKLITYSRKDVDYQYWLPIYINNEHMKEVDYLFQNSLLRLSSPFSNDIPKFKPSLVLEILVPIFTAHMTKIMRTKDLDEGNIKVAGHLYLLLSKLIENYPKIGNTINNQIEDVLAEKEESLFSKQEIENFLMTCLLSNIDILSAEFTSQLTKKIFNSTLSLCLKAKQKEQTINKAIKLLKETTTILMKFREIANFFLASSTQDDLEVRYGVINHERIIELIKRLAKINEEKRINIGHLSKYYEENLNIPEIKEEFKQTLNKLSKETIRNYLNSL